ncbi:A33 protein, partial [Nothocercus nigrocapillus]|nr:A33 protein [Nothocercus nigrocapillus]
NEPRWAVGVATDLLITRAVISPSPEEWIWAVQQRKGKFVALTDPRTTLSLSPVPKRIWVVLDCTGRQVTFVNAENGAEIY